MSEITARRLGETPPGIATRVLALIADETATTRTELSAHLGVAPSTVSATVAALIEQQLIAEEGVQSSTGGRPRKVLRPGGQDEFALAADVGGQHARIGVVRTPGRCESVSTVDFDISAGPESALAQLACQLRELAGQTAGTLRAVGVALPGPVDVSTGMVDRPSRMPGWNQFPVHDHMQASFDASVWVDNDANAMAIGEDAARSGDCQHVITVKAGSAIGAGILIGGQLYRGATSAAGDITHVRLEAAGDRPCSCGNTGCLETVASGAALQQLLAEDGVPVNSTEDVVQLAVEGHPLVTTAVRRAGSLLGEVLSANVNFFNPEMVILGGSLSTLEPFVAAVRSKLYDGCHPIVTNQLAVERTVLGAQAGLVGAGIYALRGALATTLEQLTPVTAATAARKR